MSSLPRIKTSQDWNTFIAVNPQVDAKTLFSMREQCYADIETIRKRPLIVYATKFLDALPNRLILLTFQT